MTQLLRVQNFTVSIDGYGAGEGQTLERPFGHANPGELMYWAGATASWPNRTDPGGTRGLDDYFGGGVHTVREFLDADLVDTLHVVVAPVTIGRGERLWTSPDELTDRYHLESVPSPSGVTHQLLWRR